MCAIPTFTTEATLVERSLSRRVRSRKRYVAGAVAVIGAIAFFYADASAAEAATKTSPASVSKPANTTGKSYTVKQGDTLSGIAAKNGTKVPALAGFNSILDVDKIVAGQVLRIPGPGQTTATATKKATVETPKPTPKPTAAKVPANAGLVVVATPGGPVPPQLAAKPERLKLRPIFARAAAEHRVPLELLEAMTWHESGWQNGVISKGAGAMGIGQLMPDTADFVNDELLKTKVRLDPKRPEDNIKMSAVFLRYLLNENNNDQRLALASYYQGLRSVREKGMYTDTVQYVRTVLAVQKSYF